MNFQKTWGLYDMVSNLADGDILKIQEIYELPIVALFNHLSYKISTTNVKKQS